MKKLLSTQNFKSPLKYPIYVYAYQIAELVGWAPYRVIRLWNKHGIAMRVNGYVVTTPEQLQKLWPEQWDAVLDRLEEGLLPPPTIAELKRMKKPTK